jgi:hypothetical protein
MSNPQNIDELLIDYLDGTLSPAERARVDQLLAEDVSLRKTLADLRAMHDALARLPIEKLPAEVSRAIQEEILTPRSLPMPLARHWLAVAACLLLAVTAGIVIYRQLPSGEPRTIAFNEKLTPAAADERQMLKEAAKDRLEAAVASAPAAPRPAVTAAPPPAAPPAAAAPMGGPAGGEDKLAASETKVESDAAKSVMAAPTPAQVPAPVPAAEVAAGLKQEMAKAKASARPESNAPAGNSSNSQAVLVLRTSDLASAQRQVDRVLSFNNASFRYVDLALDQQQAARDDDRLRRNDQAAGQTARGMMASKDGAVGQTVVAANLTVEQFENVRVGLNSAVSQVVEKQLPAQIELQKGADNAAQVQTRGQAEQLYQRNYAPQQQMAHNSMPRRAATANNTVGNIDLVIEFETLPLPSKPSKATLPAATQK